MRHLGSSRVFQLAQDRFFWPRMQRDIELQLFKTEKTKLCWSSTITASFFLSSIWTNHQLIFCTGTRSGGYEYVLVIIDYFTRYTQAYCTKNKLARTAAEKMSNDFILRFRISIQIHHDKGQEFQNKLFHTLEKYCGKIRTRKTRCHILRGMAGQRILTKPSLPCYVLCLSHRNLNGRTMSTRRCLPTTLQGMRQRGTHSSSCYLFFTQESLWT